MKIFKFILALFFLTVFIAACSQTHITDINSNIAATFNNSQANIAVAPTTVPDELASARKIYTEACARCHKENGEGGTVENDFGKHKVPNLKTEGKIKDPDSEFIEQITDGGDGMPAFKGKLSEQEIKDLVKFIRQDIQGKIKY